MAEFELRAVVGERTDFVISMARILAQLRHQALTRRLEGLHAIAQLGMAQLATLLFDFTGNHHGVNVGQAGLHDHRAHGVVHWVHVQGLGVDHDAIGLFANTQRAYLVVQLQRLSASNGDPLKRLATVDGGCVGQLLVQCFGLGVVQGALGGQGQSGHGEHLA